MPHILFLLYSIPAVPELLSSSQINYLSIFIGSEKAMATHSSTLAWKILWTEEPGRLQSMGSLRVGHDWATSLFTFHVHALEEEMATQSSVLAWRIPGMAGPGGLPSMVLHRVRHDWSNLAFIGYININFFLSTDIYCQHAIWVFTYVNLLFYIRMISQNSDWHFMALDKGAKSISTDFLFSQILFL